MGDRASGPTFIWLMVAVKQHYTRVMNTVKMASLNLTNLEKRIVFSLWLDGTP